MGDIKRPSKKYSSPSHPWQKARLDFESQIRKEYATGNKTEIWKMNSILRTFLKIAKKLSSQRTAQEKLEKEQLVARVKKYGLINANGDLKDILNLGLKDIMERRLQTLVFRKGFAHSCKQARQFVTHKHIIVDGKIITSPSYLVPVGQEHKISFSQRSALSSESHPERTKEKFEKVKTAETKVQETKAKVEA